MEFYLSPWISTCLYLRFIKLRWPTTPQPELQKNLWMAALLAGRSSWVLPCLLLKCLGLLSSPVLRFWHNNQLWYQHLILDPGRSQKFVCHTGSVALLSQLILHCLELEILLSRANLQIPRGEGSGHLLPLFVQPDLEGSITLATVETRLSNGPRRYHWSSPVTQI